MESPTLDHRKALAVRPHLDAIRDILAEGCDCIPDIFLAIRGWQNGQDNLAHIANTETRDDYSWVTLCVLRAEDEDPHVTIPASQSRKMN